MHERGEKEGSSPVLLAARVGPPPGPPPGFGSVLWGIVPAKLEMGAARADVRERGIGSAEDSDVLHPRRDA